MVSKSRILANLGKAVDSATTGHFLAKGVDSNGIFETILYTDLVGTPTTLDSALTSQLIDSSYVQLRQTTSGGGIDSAAVTTLIDSSYVAARSSGGGSSGFVRYEYDTTAGATTFQDSDKTGQVLSYTEDYILVHYNGILMADTDYTATSGSSVVFSSGVDSGGIVSITKFSAPSSGGGGAATYFGDRGLRAGGYEVSGGSLLGEANTIDYWDITTTGNASDFGDLTVARLNRGGASNGSRGCFISGHDGSSAINNIDYVTISTTGNAQDFGDLTNTLNDKSVASNGTYGLYQGGYTTGSVTNNTGRFTIATLGNATDFGDPTRNQNDNGACADLTYVLFGGGRDANSPYTYYAHIDYFTAATPGNAQDFGDLSLGRRATTGGSNSTIGFFAGGNPGPSVETYQRTDVIDYVTIQTPGNATDFGNMTRHTNGCAVACNATRGTIVQGNAIDGSNNTLNDETIEYITIATPGNATDFGDLTVGVHTAGGLSGSPS